MLEQQKIIDKMIQEFYTDVHKYLQMKDYYDGDHDITWTYQQELNRNNQVIVNNMVQKFIDEEIQYTLGNFVSYVSKSGDNNIIDTIDSKLFHYKTNHNQLLMKDLEIYGTAYELSYIDYKGRFCSRILNPTNSIVYVDEDNTPQIFIHFYKKKYQENKFHDIYYSDGRIEIYKDNTLIDTKSHIFKGCPVSVCEIDIEQTIYSKIKLLNDSYNKIVSDQINIISDYRNAYLVIAGVKIDPETEEALKLKGILSFETSGATVDWLMKEMNDAYIFNMINNLKNSMYENCNHIDSTEKLQSNTSSLAIRSRLLFLEQRCKTMFDIVADTIYDRLERLFEYLYIKNQSFNLEDIRLNYTPNIPQDLITIVQAISQLGDKISLQTALSQIPWVENPLQEMAQIKKEREELQELDLDKITSYE